MAELKKYGLSAQEANALISYIGNGYRQINIALSKGQENKNAKLIMTALGKLPHGTKQQTLYRIGRGFSVIYDETGKPVGPEGDVTRCGTWQNTSFLSTSMNRTNYSRDPKKKAPSNNYYYVIYGATQAANVDPGGLNRAESEWIYPPGIKFQVLGYKRFGNKRGNHDVVVFLQEPDAVVPKGIVAKTLEHSGASLGSFVKKKLGVKKAPCTFGDNPRDKVEQAPGSPMLLQIPPSSSTEADQDIIVDPSDGGTK